MKMPRTGFGYDVHRFDEPEGATQLRLCGIDIPFRQRLKGHSDADVALHALTDALLGALCMGDIGEHFPPSDAQWKDRDSRVFLDFAIKALTERGGALEHTDITIVCEQPKIGPHKNNMRTRLAEILQITENRINVKATTTEGLGFTGRKEGIAVYAVATISI
ncbi:MAG: 2-C-methyl-D-erythritol 2,4-cyclodiphosphate synthase [Pseudomonadota bacterium]